LIQDYGFRLYNPAIGKFLSVDPLTSEYPELTPYQFASNTPILNIDLDGLESVVYSKAKGVFGSAGHTFIEVNGTVFDYGQYEGSFGNGVTGPGILLRLDGQDAIDYIANTLARDEDYEVYLIEDVNADEAFNYLNFLYNSTTDGFLDQSLDETPARHVDTYAAGVRTCTTICTEALLAGESAAVNETFHNPTNLGSRLEELSLDPQSSVFNVTEQANELTRDIADDDYEFPIEPTSSGTLNPGSSEGN